MSCSSPAARRKEEETRELESQAKTKRIEEADEVRREDGKVKPERRQDSKSDPTVPEKHSISKCVFWAWLVWVLITTTVN